MHIFAPNGDYCLCINIPHRGSMDMVRFVVGEIAGLDALNEFEAVF